MPLAIPELETPSGREQLHASLKGWMPWVGEGSLAILDQGLFARSNFLLNVLQARRLAPVDYGAFALAYSVFLLLGVFHTAILTEPMLVFGPGRYCERFPEYLGILLRGHFALMLPGAALLAAAAGGAVYLLILLASILTLRTAGRLTPATGFLAKAAASLITCLLLLILLRLALATDSSAIRAVAADHWRYGKWAAAAAGP